MISGFVTMLLFALVSGISVTMAIPLFDYVFGNKHEKSVYTSLSFFIDELLRMLGIFLGNLSFSNIFYSQTYDNLIADLKMILSNTDPYTLLTAVSYAMIILILLKNIVFYTNKVIFATLRGKVVNRLRNILFEKYIQMPISYHKKTPIGDMQVRLTSDVAIISNSFIQASFSSLRDIALVFIYTFIALFINYKLFLYIIIVVPVFSLSVSYLGKKIKKYSLRIQKTYSLLYSRMVEVLNGIKIVKSFSKEGYEINKFKTENRKFYKAWLKSVLYSSVNTPVSEINSTIIGVIVLIIGGKIVINNPEEFSFGSFFAFLFAIFSIMHPLKNLTKVYTQIKKASVSLDRVFEIMNVIPKIHDDSDAVKVTNFNKSIIFSNVSFAYEKDKILDDISLTINKGETVALVGSSGSGKTTFINLLERFYDVSEGEILLDGINIKNIAQKNLHDLYGTVTQEPILFHGTIENNIRYGSNRDISFDEVRKAAEISYSDKFIDELSGKYGYMIDPKTSNLSGGQKQRLCIARAIVANPPILIFDEATSSLDSESEQFVQKAIEKATQNRTVVVIAHRLSTILHADKIVVIEKGQISGVGKHQELLQTNEKYKTLYEIQFKDNGQV